MKKKVQNGSKNVNFTKNNSPKATHKGSSTMLSIIPAATEILTTTKGSPKKYARIQDKVSITILVGVNAINKPKKDAKAKEKGCVFL